MASLNNSNGKGPATMILDDQLTDKYNSVKRSTDEDAFKFNSQNQVHYISPMKNQGTGPIEMRNLANV